MAAYACMAWVGCACDDRTHDSVPSCRHGWNMTYEVLAEDAATAGLVYDGRCLAQHVADLAAIGCEDQPEMDAWSVTGPGRCNVWHGTKLVDERCTPLRDGLSDCAQGLACWNDRCADPCAAARVGARCGGVFGLACPADAICTLGSCVAATPPAAIGESCGITGCVEGAWCRELCPDETCTATCIEGRDDGVPCTIDVECESGFCSEGQCAPGPGTGEPCVAERCLAGRECVAGICGDPEAAICP
jgi:hypothetical protein